ncbi:MAG: T9SS type A sorting domain-containing protein, partial [Candidatus Cloacimonetes bacterium]|nr:T9SS type A sorting domain-containing protein [Candidatus Cloacimonadota bacterium]
SFIRPGKHLGVAFNSSEQIIEIISNYEELIPESIEAIEKSPAWMRADLENVFCQLSDTDQAIWAGEINNSFDPFIDEIAFSIANSSVAFLSSIYSNPDLFTENAILIYLTDNDLEYVEIVDYGTSTTDENYYSTTLYWKINELGELVQVEVPKEIYYMYLVHPKITDEISAYIDPDIIENNNTHTNNIVDPPDGVFWRNFLYNYSDTGYPRLKDMLETCPTVWDASLTTDDDAILTITEWVNESMTFTSDYERPHQPVRIYRKHIGRCGEHADLTAAACRSALIPCTSILAISSDHTWNEFWDEGWHHWEPVNNSINNPLIYENGWGWQFASVFEIKSNGFLTPVTGTYSEGTATIIIYALDCNGDPIDGAKITLKVPGWDNWGYTDNEGKYTFIVGEGRTYYARMDSEIGNDPTTPNQVYLVVSNTVNGQSYTYSLNAAGTMPETDFTEISVPEDVLDDYRLEVDFTVPDPIITGAIIMDDIDNTDFYNSIEDDGVLNFFMTDYTNYVIYENSNPFDGFNVFSEATDGFVSFDIPSEIDWYAFFDNGNNLNNPQHLTTSISLYLYSPIGVDEPEIQPGSISLLQNYPNPFNPTTTIKFTTEDTEKNTEIIIYNIKGQKIRQYSIFNNQSSIVWDGTDDTGKSVSSGIYLYQLKAGDKSSQTRKMLLVK